MLPIPMRGRQKVLIPKKRSIITRKHRNKGMQLHKESLVICILEGGVFLKITKRRMSITRKQRTRETV